MKYHTSPIVFLVLGLAFSIPAFGQTKKAFLKAADEAVLQSNYYGALTWYQEALEFDTTSLEVNYAVAEAAEKFNAYGLAAKHYQYVLDNDTEGVYPETSFRLANMRMMLGEYEPATDAFNIYLGEHSDENPKLTAGAKTALQKLAFAKERAAVVDTTIIIERLADGINTPYSEFGGQDLNGELYYSSHQFTYKDKNKNKDVLLGRIMKRDGVEGTPLGSTLDIKGKSVANGSWNHDGTKLYFSVCDYINDDTLKCALYVTEVVNDSTFSEPEMLPATVNDTSGTSTMPFIHYDADTKVETLYFVSDRQGGAGGLDIYSYVLNQANALARPLSDLNTAGNDITPFYDGAEKKLYFSSDGRQGLGGYDVYTSSMNTVGTWSAVEHMVPPVNSSYHDIYYRLKSEGNDAYLSSNRVGASFIDEGQEACCFDIYEVRYDVIDIPLNAMTYDLLTGDSLTGVTVRLIDADTGVELDRITNDLGKDHKFNLKSGRKYLLISDKEGFYPDTTEISTIGVDGPIEQKIYLDSDRYALDVFTFVKTSKLPLTGVQVRLIDETDGSIADQVQLNESGNDFVFILEPNKTYRVEASKYGYITDIATINTSGDNLPKRIRQDMFLDSYDLNNHLPVSLYFDNDMPDPGSRRTGTDKKYADLYYDYIAREGAFVKANPEERSGLETFFENRVKAGYVQMQKFYDELFKALEAGARINLTIKGHTSPLAVNDYNLVLGQRRVTSVKNDMGSYRGGILRKYIESGQLSITDISFGEETQKTNASDNYNNKRQSVFSVDASLERRVEILKATNQ